MTRRKAPSLNPIAAWMLMGAVAVVGLMAAQPAFAEQEHEPSCTLTTLLGLYIFDATGYIISPTGPAPKAVVVFLNMNGDGTFTSVATANFNGTVVAENKHDTGHYTVNEDCTGTLGSDTQGPHFDIFIAPGGATFHMIQTDPSQVSAGEAKRVSRKRSR